MIKFRTMLQNSEKEGTGLFSFKDNRKFIIDTIQDYTDYTQEMYAERKRDRRTTSLNLRYNFGKQQKKKWDRRNFGGRGGGGGGGMDMDY